MRSAMLKGCLCGKVSGVAGKWEGGSLWGGRTFCGVCGDTVAVEQRACDEEKRAMGVLRSLAPPLDGTTHKGQGGRVGIIGGSELYTGAPYFASMAALRVGAELAYVLTAKEAMGPIKSYSPELMVAPMYATPDITTRDEQDKMAATIEDMGWRFHAVVVGPGLGTNPGLVRPLCATLPDVFEEVPVVVDADGLRLLCNAPEMVSGIQTLVLTPNMRELYLFYPKGETRPPLELAKELALRFSATIVLKGQEDVITDGTSEVKCTLTGCPRRVGGLGDFLCGTISVLLGWRALGDHNSISTLDVCHAACSLVRKASELAFDAKLRSMSTVDVLDMMGPASQQMFPARL